MKKEPRLTPEEKHGISLARLGTAAVQSMNSYRRLIYRSVCLLREIRRPDGLNYILRFRQLHRLDHEILIRTMFPLRNTKENHWRKAA